MTLFLTSMIAWQYFLAKMATANISFTALNICYSLLPTITRFRNTYHARWTLSIVAVKWTLVVAVSRFKTNTSTGRRECATLDWRVELGNTTWTH